MNVRIKRCRYEPSLEDLLADEVMTPVLRSAGLERQELREMMVEAARRIEDRGRGGIDEESELHCGSSGEYREFEPDT
jgi:hypothetical protein